MNQQLRIAPLVSATGFSSILDAGNHFDLCAVLTLLLLLLYAPEGWYGEIPLSLVAIAGFVFSALRKSALFWGIATLVAALAVGWKWYMAENHKFLLVYWCLAIFVSLLTSSPEHTLKTSARWLVALVFAFAVVQKTRSVDYLSGAFFYAELLIDGRFEALARVLGGITTEMKDANLASIEALKNFCGDMRSAPLQTAAATSGLATTGLANFVTWWNYLIQLAIAVLFFPVFPWRTSGAKNYFLLLFLFTTYLFAPVIGFGWVLAVMGVAQTDPDEKRMRAMYVLAIFFLQAYSVPWQSLLTRLLTWSSG